jgi:hypothetical protein
VGSVWEAQYYAADHFNEPCPAASQAGTANVR